MSLEIAKILATEFNSNRFIAYFDFLGFSNIVKKNSLIESLEHFAETIMNVTHVLNDQKKILYKGKLLETNFILFSDTLILFSKDNEPDYLESMCSVCCHLIGYLLDNGFPTRCVITNGQFYHRNISDNQDLFLGKGLVRSYELEKQINFCGGIIDPNLEQDKNLEQQIKELQKANIIARYHVPMKQGLVKEYYSLLWPKFYRDKFKKGSSDVRPDMLKITKSGKGRLYGTQLNWPEEIKIKNTETFVNWFDAN